MISSGITNNEQNEQPEEHTSEIKEQAGEERQEEESEEVDEFGRLKRKKFPSEEETGSEVPKEDVVEEKDDDETVDESEERRELSGEPPREEEDEGEEPDADPDESERKLDDQIVNRKREKVEGKTTEIRYKSRDVLENINTKELPIRDRNHFRDRDHIREHDHERDRDRDRDKERHSRHRERDRDHERDIRVRDRERDRDRDRDRNRDRGRDRDHRDHDRDRYRDDRDRRKRSRSRGKEDYREKRSPRKDMLKPEYDMRSGGYYPYDMGMYRSELPLSTKPVTMNYNYPPIYNTRLNYQYGVNEQVSTNPSAYGSGSGREMGSQGLPPAYPPRQQPNVSIWNQDYSPMNPVHYQRNIGVDNNNYPPSTSVPAAPIMNVPNPNPYRLPQTPMVNISTQGNNPPSNSGLVQVPYPSRTMYQPVSVTEKERDMRTSGTSNFLSQNQTGVTSPEPNYYPQGSRNTNDNIGQRSSPQAPPSNSQQYTPHNHPLNLKQYYRDQNLVPNPPGGGYPHFNFPL